MNDFIIDVVIKTILVVIGSVMASFLSIPFVWIIDRFIGITEKQKSFIWAFFVCFTIFILLAIL